MKFFFTFLFLLTLLTRESFSKENVLFLEDENKSYILGPFLKILKDPSRAMTIKDVSSPENKHKFKKSKALFPNMGVNEEKVNYWVKFKVRKKLTSKVDWLFYSHYVNRLKEIQVFKKEKNGNWTSEFIGSLVPFKNKKIKNRYFSFYLNQGEESTYYIKIYGTIVRMPFFISTEKEILKRESTENIWIGLYLGIIVALIFYNLFLGINTKLKSFYYYIIFAFVSGFNWLSLNGFLAQTFFKDNVWVLTDGFFLCWFVSLITANLFTISYLDVKRNFPFIYKVLIFSFWTNFLFPILWMLQDADLLILKLFAIKRFFWAFNLLASLYIFKKGYIRGLFYFLSFLCVIIGVIYFNLMALGQIPYFEWGDQVLSLGIIFNLIFLSIGLSFHYSSLKEETIRMEEKIKKILLQSLEKEKQYSRGLKISSLQHEEDHKQLTTLVKKIENSNLTLENKVKERTMALDISLGQLKKALSDKSTFFAKMSHELRTPLNAILGFSQLLLKEREGDDKKGHINVEKKKEYLDCIFSSGKSLLGLIDEVHDLSKLDLEKLDIQKVSFSLKNLLNNVCTFYLNETQKKGLLFFYQVDQELPQLIIFDELRVKQILYNILGNSLKFTEKGFLKLDVFIKDSEEKKGFLDFVFTIKDSGIGIKKENLNLIFKNFEQINDPNSMKNRGSGLGLYITKRIIEEMKGTVEVKSEYGEGTTFIVTLKNIEIDQSLNSSKNSIQELQYEFFGGRLLLVDDLENNLKLLEAYLSPYNFDIETAKDGLELISKAIKFKPDLIITDVKMPTMDGEEAKKKLDVISNLKDIPIIALSAVLNPGEISGKFNSFLKKPVEKKALLAEISKYLKSKTITMNVSSVEEQKENSGNFEGPKHSVNPFTINFTREGDRSLKLIEGMISEIEIVLQSMDIISIENFFDTIRKHKEDDLLEGFDIWFDFMDNLFQSFQTTKLQQELEKNLEYLKELLEENRTIIK
jgi:signal transduction histidine kinase/DNA-binding response OmpR family regulator